MEIYSSLQILISGLIAGAILFQSGVVAPTIFTKVSEPSRAPFLRSVFPKLFKAITLGGVLFITMTLLSSTASVLVYIVGGYTIFAGVLCDALIPATNKAKDDGDSKKFALLHKISVLLTMAVLLVHLSWIFF